MIITPIKCGDKIQVHTNAELLNYVYGTSFDGFMQTTYQTSKDTMAWMVFIDGKERSGFKNTFRTDYDTIVETYVGSKTVLPPKFDDGSKCENRAVFQKMNVINDKEHTTDYFKFLGMYRYDKTASAPFRRVLKKVGNELHI